MFKFRLQILLGALLRWGVANATPILIVGPGGLNSDTTVSWAQLGGDGTLLNSTFTATPAGALTGVNTIGGSLSGPNSILAVVCPVTSPATCSWDPQTVGFVAGQTLIWTSDAGDGGNGPLVLTFPAVYGAGLWLQADTTGAFIASITATYAGTSTKTYNGGKRRIRRSDIHRGAEWGGQYDEHQFDPDVGGVRREPQRLRG